MDRIDASIGAVPCTSSTRPASPFVGLFARETDTGNLILCTATGPAVWTRVFIQNQSRWPQTIEVERAAGDGYTARLPGDTGSRLYLRTDGVIIFGDGAGLTDTNLYRSAANVLKTDDLLDVQDLTVRGVDQGRGQLDYVDSITADAAHTAEAVSLTSNSVTFVNGRCYEVEFAGNMATAVANNFGLLRVRKTNAAGAQLGFFELPLGTAGPQYYIYGKFRIKRTAGSNLAAVLALTSQGSVGNINFTGATTDVRYMKIYDCGPAASYPNAITIT